VTLLSVLCWPPSVGHADRPAATGVVAAADDADDEAMFRLRDEFNGKLELEWKIIRPDPTHVSFDKNLGKLTITTQTGSIHLKETERNARTPAKNLYVLPNPVADGGGFVLTTCIESFQPYQYSHQAGLLVYDDDDNYFKWVIEWNGARPRFNLLRETEQQSIIEVRPDVPDAQGVWLRLIKRGDSYERSYSTDGEEFIPVGERVWGGDAPKWVGIVAKNGSGGGASEIDAAFDFFEARSLTDAEANDPHYLERRKLQGSWEVVSCRFSGKPLTGAPLSRFKFTGSGVVINERTQSLATEFTLEVATEPKRLKFAALSSRAKTPASGVYSVKDDTLVICLGLQPDAPPPAELETNEGDGRLLVTLKRMPAIEADAIQRNAQPRQRHFRKLDKNDDEHLTSEEFIADYRQLEAIEQGTELFTIIDRDGDEKLTFDEFKTRQRKAAFLVMDLNADGGLSAREFSMGEMKAAPQDRADLVFKLTDVDEDGQLTFKEFRARPPDAYFEKLDVDEDDLLSLDEYAAGNLPLVRTNRCESVFGMLDRDGDVSISRDEFRKKPEEFLFARRDADGDGRLTLQEFGVWARSPEQRAERKRTFELRDTDGDGKLTFRESAHRPGEADFWDRDEDGDARLTLDEFRSSGRASELSDHANALFKLIDRNRDGRVSLSEYRTQPEEARFPLIDLDGDQSLSLEEFIGTIRGKEQVAAAEKSFKTKDKDADGGLSFEEFRGGEE
jgi:uncharacterized protein (TIGR03067 family)